MGGAVGEVVLEWLFTKALDAIFGRADLTIVQWVVLGTGIAVAWWLLFARRMGPDEGAAPSEGKDADEGRNPDEGAAPEKNTALNEGRSPDEGRADAKRIVFAAIALLVTGALIIVVRPGPDPVTPEPDPNDDCGRSTAGAVVEVVVVWEDAELRAFCDTVGLYGPDVQVDSVGVGIDGALEDRLDDPPDVALIPQPSLVRSHAARGRLCPVQPEVEVLFPTEWNRFVTEQEGGNGEQQVFGAFVKATHKTVLWFDLAAFRDHGPVGSPGYFGPPYDWAYDDFVAWLEANVHDPGHEAPFTFPAEDRWPLTDLFENQLAARAPVVYDDLSRGDDVWDDREAVAAVEDVLWDMAELWRIAGVFPEGQRPESTDLAGVADQLEARDAAVGFAPSFLAGPIQKSGGGPDIGVVGFPGPEEPPRPTGSLPTFGDRPVIVGADIATIFKQDGSCSSVVGAHDFVRWLTDTEAMDAWAENDPGFLTPNSRSPHEAGGSAAGDHTAVYLTGALRYSGDQLFFDLSDDQFARGEGSTERVWDIFHEFFTQVVVDRADPAGPIACVVDRLRAEYRGEAWPAPCEESR